MNNSCINKKKKKGWMTESWKYEKRNEINWNGNIPQDEDDLEDW